MPEIHVADFFATGFPDQVSRNKIAYQTDEGGSAFIEGQLPACFFSPCAPAIGSGKMKDRRMENKILYLRGYV
jgi:hypothetical protein